MNNALSLSIPSENPLTRCSDLSDGRERGVTPRQLEELAHELRQPLSTIESLAYYLELTERNELLSRHLQSIRAMVSKAHQILDHAVIS